MANSDDKKPKRAKKTASPKKKAPAKSNKTTIKKPNAAKKPNTVKKQSKPKRTAVKTKNKSSWKKRTLWILAKLVLVGFVVLAMYMAYLNLQIRERFEGRTFDIAAQVLAQPLSIYEGKTLSAHQLNWTLDNLGYRRDSKVDQPGEYWSNNNQIIIFKRGFEFWDRTESAKRFTVQLSNNSITRLTDDNGQTLILERLDPQIIGELYGQDKARELIKLVQVPTTLKEGFLAVEDSHFYSHHGISITGIARALFSNIQAGSLTQGGSTITQQLVKNLFLYNKRSLVRKVNEALMAILIDAQYNKDEILTAYFNEVYYTQDGARSIHGLQLTSRYFFSTQVEYLQLHQQALLIAMVKGPYYYHPINHPKRTTARRNLVLDIMAQKNIITEQQAKQAQAQALDVKISKRSQKSSQDFIQLVKQQMDEQYYKTDLASKGIKVFTSFEPYVHHQALTQLKSRIKIIEAQHKITTGQLQSAVVITDTTNGNIRTIIGSSQGTYSGFNRALEAKRPIGSLIKPFIYSEALASGEYHLASLLDDSPINMPIKGQGIWSPKNYDHKSHGTPTLLQALAKSYNLSSVYLSQQRGVDKLVDTLKDFGLKEVNNQNPSLALGALELSPLEVASLYQVFASGGFKMELNTLIAVVDEHNQILQRHQPQMELKIDTHTMSLMLYALNYNMRAGTGKFAYQYLPKAFMVAGKTGTSNDARDSWFVGFSEDSLASVWLGFDNNQPMPITGSSGALRVWTDIFKSLPLTMQRASQPDNISWFWIDLNTGKRTQEQCENAILVPFKFKQIAPNYIPCRTSDSNNKQNWLQRLLR
ncbi:MAG: penicillin-binding protein 1B [Saccharospirillaceae bacterium]|nr:penicillin-binding protein 1B [Pseudomonadales bacterium]NRB77778.1 penicillin-binding protein 1B [Saccharospirillaceae bacterium]